MSSHALNGHAAHGAVSPTGVRVENEDGEPTPTRIQSMIRRISTKWVLAVLAVVILPFLGFAWYVDSFVSQRFSDDVVRYHLLGHAADLAERLDHVIDENRRAVRVLSKDRTLKSSLAWPESAGPLRLAVEPVFSAQVRESGKGFFVLALNLDGSLEICNRLDGDGEPLDPWILEQLGRRDWSQEPWFEEVLKEQSADFDVFRSDLVPPGVDSAPEDHYHFGFAQRVDFDREGFGAEEQVGMLVHLVPWSIVQGEISSYGVIRPREEVSEFASDNIYRSTYAWVWAEDADTILAHRERELYGERVSGEAVQLPQLVEAARRRVWGMYPDYEFGGERKKAAFHHTRSSAEGGLGWVVGVGVDFTDIYGPIHDMSSTIAKASSIVLLIAIFVTILVARRTTRPVQELEAFTRRVASGDLDARVDVRGHDELADLARSFNRMTRELKENRAQLVKAEKDAAWREMARQVAHEIKNPLTPIQLSASLLRRAHDEKSDEFPAILERTTDVIDRQVRNMRDIAKDFYRFAGEHRAPVPVDAAEILREVFELNAAWAETEGIELDLDTGAAGAEPPIVEVDPDELRRALVNLVSNAMEAMDGSGSLHGQVRVEGDEVAITVRDTGKGIPAEVLERLFEPYFTTRSSGTGLGLAIVRRIVEDRGGSVTLENAGGGAAGAVARIVLPRLMQPQA